MKKRLLIIFSAIFLLVFAMPALSGCKGEVGYTLSEEGGKHYIASLKGTGTGLKGELKIAEEIDGVPVTEIADRGFSATSVTKVVIPASIKKIGLAAFAYCNSLSEVEFESGGVTEVPQATFAYCYSLSSVKLSDDMESIGRMAFLECGRLTEINFPQGLKTIGVEAFRECTYLAEVSFPETLERIGEIAFYSTDIRELTIPASVHDSEIEREDENGKKYKVTLRGIGCGAFHNCQRLKKVTVLAGVETISPSAFGACSALESVYLPATLKKIEGALYDGDTFMYGHAFHNCPALKNVYFAGSRETWREIKITVGISDENENSLEYNGAQYDNKAIVNANLYFDAQPV